MAKVLTFDKHADKLTQVAEPVLEGERVRELVDAMFDAMDYPNGIGLAAPQIGINKRIIVYQVPHVRNGIVTSITKGHILNPEIFWKKGAMTIGYEGCLSFPGIEVAVPRWPRIKVRGFDLRMSPITIGGKGLVARVLQHEIDHLNGRTLAYYEALRQEFAEHNNADNVDNEDIMNG